MKFQRTALLRFYDDPADTGFASADRGAHVSAVTGVIGEDLLLGLLFHYFETQSSPTPCLVLPDKCKGLDKKGKRLDAWITIGNDRIGQVEIKNWSAHSLGEQGLAPVASPDELARAAKSRWNKFFGNNDKMPGSTLKVLIDMPVPKEHENRLFQRWLCFWLPLAQDAVSPVTSATILGKEVHVFSGSIYLRQLQQEVIELQTPRIEARLKLLASLRAPDED